MGVSDKKPEKYGLLPHLFKLIDKLADDQQWMLLRQLLKENVTLELFKLIIEMPESRHKKLIGQLENIIENRTPVRTVSLEEDESSMRGHRRKRCLIPVRYQCQGQEYSDYILDISSVGVFIETKDTFSVEQDLILDFQLPNSQHPLRLEGRIVWIGQKGIGVKFNKLTPNEDHLIQAFIEREENK
jgi:Tfp pilus assembly protein PilZ